MLCCTGMIPWQPFLEERYCSGARWSSPSTTRILNVPRRTTVLLKLPNPSSTSCSRTYYSTFNLKRVAGVFIGSCPRGKGADEVLVLCTCVLVASICRSHRFVVTSPERAHAHKGPFVEVLNARSNLYKISKYLGKIPIISIHLSLTL